MSKDLVTLFCPPTEFEANVLAIVLKDNGIEAFVFATPTMGVGVGLNAGRLGVPIQVKREDLEMARQILLDNKQHSVDIDWNELGVGDDDDSVFVPKPMPIAAKVALVFVVLAFVAMALLNILNL